MSTKALMPHLVRVVRNEPLIFGNTRNHVWAKSSRALHRTNQASRRTSNAFHSGPSTRSLRMLAKKDTSQSVTSPAHKHRAPWLPKTAILDAKYFPDGGRIFIALGSNMGNRLENIENACRHIDADPDMRILRTSALYETEPMYVEDQDKFMNGMCEIDTKLEPMELLDRLQAIEQRMGRVKVIDKGPRNIDLDIVSYQGRVMGTERLTLPHALANERMFVLRPLFDMVSARLAPELETWCRMLDCRTEAITLANDGEVAVTNLVPRKLDLRINLADDPTMIMSIVNVTPDSFSDGGDHNTTDVEQFKSMIKAQIASGVKIIDVGGQSSRPNAPDVAAEEEIARVLPAIEAIKSLPEAESVAISIDTYRAAVAEAAIKAGAHIVNDISAGSLDPDMLSTVAKLGCTYIMMHMRGTPSTMMSAENCSYPNGLAQTIVEELEERVEVALAAGIRRWRIILDPGLGFSKTVDQNLQILRHFEDFRDHVRVQSYGWLIGSSRKSFIGKITGVTDPKERDWATAATVTAAIEGGADIVRIHNIEAMKDVVKMSDAIYR